MSRAPKEKQNYENAFKKLYEENNIDGNAALLRKMFTKYYKNILDKDTDRQEWINKQLPDFRKKIKGERSFTESDKKAIERALEMSWADIVEPLPDSEIKKKKEFDPIGIRYAAYMDDESLYEELYAQLDADEYTHVLFNSDEYGKSVIDYLLEYRSVNGLRYMINKEFIYPHCNDLELHGRAYYTRDHSDELWDRILSIDDEALYSKLLEGLNLTEKIYRPDDTILEKMLNSRKFLNAVCKEREHPTTKLKYMPPILLVFLNFALEKGKNADAQYIFNKYKSFIDDRIEEFKNSADVEKSHFNVLHSVYDGLANIYYTDKNRVYSDRNETPSMYALDLSGLPTAEHGELAEQMEDYSVYSIMKRLEVKELSEMEYGEAFTRNGICYIKMKPDVSLEALKYLTCEKNCKYLPKYLGEENGVTMVAECRRNWYRVDMSELGAMLAEIHSLSREKLGDGKVYKYSGGFSDDNYNCFSHNEKTQTPVINFWRKCEISTPMDDLITAFLKLECRYHSDHLGAESKLDAFLQLLNGYGSTCDTVDLGDKLDRAADELIQKAIDSGKDEEITRCYMLKSFIVIHRKKLNELNTATKEGAEKTE